jgi:hypothetical protein
MVTTKTILKMIDLKQLIQEVYSAKTEAEIQEVLMKIFHIGQLSALQDPVIPSELSEKITMKNAKGNRLKFGNQWQKVSEGRLEKHMGAYSASITYEKEGYKKAKNIQLSTNIGGTLYTQRMTQGLRSDLIQRANAVLYTKCQGNINLIKKL